ncbi:muramoyltetrapeptide carboxypeptidase [soil metagenome]
MRIEFIAPAGYPSDTDSIDRAAAYFASHGFDVTASDAVFARHQRFAGDDATRADSLKQALESDAGMVMAVRGGYGAVRLLDKIDWKAVGRRVKRSGVCLVGHSDLTAIQLALLAKGGAASLAGPMASYDFGSIERSEFTERHFWGLVMSDSFTVDVKAAGQPSIEAAGTLWGGNAAVLCGLIGTPYMPKHEGGILVLEDTGEYPYRIERMFNQLALSGILARQQAVVLGSFNDYKLTATDSGYDMDSAIDRLREISPAPVLTGLPFGHTFDKITWPIGGQCHLETRRGGYRLTFSDYPRPGMSA